MPGYHLRIGYAQDLEAVVTQLLIAGFVCKKFMFRSVDFNYNGWRNVWMTKHKVDAPVVFFGPG